MTCNVGSPGMVVAVWVVGGLLSLAGALTYAELAALMPRAGGEYVFIRDAYGRLPGFLYGWTRFFVASTGGTAGLAAGFAIFLNIVTGGHVDVPWLFLHVWGRDIGVGGLQAIAVVAIVVVTIVNCAAIAVGGRIAMVLTGLKITLVCGVGIAAAALAQGSWTHYALSASGSACDGVASAARGGFAGFGAAMLGAMWAYNGWNEITYVSEEGEGSAAQPAARDHRRPRHHRVPLHRRQRHLLLRADAGGSRGRARSLVGRDRSRRAVAWRGCRASWPPRWPHRSSDR